MLGMRNIFHSVLSSRSFVHLTHASFTNLSVIRELGVSILKCTLGDPRHHANWRTLSSISWLLSWPDALTKASGNSCFSHFFFSLLHIISSQTEGETMETVTYFILGGLQIIANGDCSRESKRCLLLGRKDMTNLDSILKNRDIILPTKVCYHQSYGFFSSHVWMWELDYKESWVLKNWCFWSVVLEKTLESPLDCKEIKPVHPTGNQSWIFIGRTDADAILWLPNGKNWLIWGEALFPVIQSNISNWWWFGH